jgi:hypothetical protein
MCVRVVDYGDGPLGGASVTITDLQTGKVLSARAARNGEVCVTKIPESLYSVEAGLEGFLNVRYYPVRVAPEAVQRLSFRLPFGEITEGMLVQDAILSGALKRDALPIQDAKICILPLEGEIPRACAVTNELGEYAITLPPGAYRVDVKLIDGLTQRTDIKISGPGTYRNLIAVPPPKDK